MSLFSWIKLHFLRLFQDGFIFKPIHNYVIKMKSPSYHELYNTDEKYITTADNVNIQIWHHKPREKNLPTFVCFHGNTGNWIDVGEPKPDEDYDRHYRLELLQSISEQKAGLIAVSMRGYGNSQRTKPSEKGFEKDLDAVIKYIKEQDIPKDELIILGESLGAAMAYRLAAKLTQEEHNPPAMLVVIASFSNMTKRVMQDHPDLDEKAVEKALKHKFDNLANTALLSNETHLMLFHGKNDAATFNYHSHLLEEEAQKCELNVVYEEMDCAHLDWSEYNITHKAIEHWQKMHASS